MFNIINRMKKRWLIFGLIVLVSVFISVRRAPMYFPFTVTVPFPGVDSYTQHSLTIGQPMPTINFSFSIDPHWRCRDVHDAFTVIVSAPANWDKRNSIRDTWLHHLTAPGRKMSADYVFLIGTTNDSEIQRRVAAESANYGDLLQMDSLDTYRRLSLKTVAMLQWTLRNCRSKFVLKVDDDVYVNVKNLETVVLTLPSENRTVYGTSFSDSKPIRRMDDDKWGISYDVWPWSTYPPYVTGNCYLLSTSAVEDLLNAAKMTPYFAFEDVYISGLCAVKAAVSVVASNRFFVKHIPSLVTEGFVTDTIAWQSSVSLMSCWHSAWKRLLLDGNSTTRLLGDLQFQPVCKECHT